MDTDSEKLSPLKDRINAKMEKKILLQMNTIASPEQQENQKEVGVSGIKKTKRKLTKHDLSTPETRKKRFADEILNLEKLMIEENREPSSNSEIDTRTE